MLLQHTIKLSQSQTLDKTSRPSNTDISNTSQSLQTTRATMQAIPKSPAERESRFNFSSSHFSNKFINTSNISRLNHHSPQPNKLLQMWIQPPEKQLPSYRSTMPQMQWPRTLFSPMQDQDPQIQLQTKQALSKKVQ